MKNRTTALNRVICIVMVAVLLLPLFFCPNQLPKVRAVTTNQQNMVDRADYMYNLTWVCQTTVSGWKGNYTFYEGSTYRVPYAWPVTAGKWVPYGVSFDTFLAAAADASSDFYTKQSYYTGNSGSYSTYYGNDCSTFVSWCWDISTRQTTSSLPNYSTEIGSVTTSNVNNLLQLGDALNYVGSHVVLVTDIVYDSSGAITSIEITEQTPPQLKRSTYTVSGLVSKYGSSYNIYRYTGTVSAAPTGTSVNPDNYTVPTSDISYTAGSTMPSGSQVYWVQAVLYQLGYTIDVDGIYGSGSAGVVSQFQSDYGLTSNGVVDAATRAMLIKCWTNNYGYYTVTASALNVRTGAGSSYDKITSVTNGTQVAVIGFNSDKSWAKVNIDGTIGWCSMSYLSYVRLFDYSISYNPNNSSATGTLSTSVQKAYSQYTALGSDVTASGTNLMGWWLFRLSDNAWYVDGTGWVADSSISGYTPKLYAVGDTFTLDETVLNENVGDDGYILFGVWEEINIPLGVYSVTATNLNMRDGVGTSANVLTVLNNGDQVQVIGYNDAKTWVNILFGEYNGWVNVKYLQYVRDFQYTVSYVTGNDASAPSSVVLEKNGSLVISETSLSGYTLDGWTLQRASDGAWWVDGAGWVSNDSISSYEKAVFAAGLTFGITDSVINTAAGDDSFIFNGVWTSVTLTGDINGDGSRNAKDSMILRKYLASAISIDSIDFESADLDGNGKLNSKDSLILRRLISAGA